VGGSFVKEGRADRGGRATERGLGIDLGWGKGCGVALTGLSLADRGFGSVLDLTAGGMGGTIGGLTSGFLLAED